MGEALLISPKNVYIKQKFDEIVQKAGGMDALPPEIREYIQKWETTYAQYPKKESS